MSVRHAGPLASIPGDHPLIKVFGLVLGLVLAGYMFMGRGFAHLEIGPVYVGEVALALAVAVICITILRRGAHPRVGWTMFFIVGFVVLGAARTVPFLSTYGLDALRDGALWGYAAFAVAVYAVADAAWTRTAVTVYVRLVPIFAAWLPIAWLIFKASQVGVDPLSPGSNHPLVFFKAGDMAIHVTGAFAVIVLASQLKEPARAFAARLVVSLPLAWTVFLTGAASRGALLGAAAGIGATAIAAHRLRRWSPVLAAALVVVLAMNVPAQFGVTTSPTPIASGTPVESESPQPSAKPSPSPTADPGRVPTVSQWYVNFVSIFTPSNRSDLDGTRAFRLAWWSKIIDYTVFGPHFWTGKGFGVNLADDDGFQPTKDHSLRAPHNSHMTVLARMGVPGLSIWIALQASFFFGLLGAIRAYRRANDEAAASLCIWITVVWTAMMVVTSFDPYLEGPQGGIWYWSVIGLGLAITQRAPRTR